MCLCFNLLNGWLFAAGGNKSRENKKTKQKKNNGINKHKLPDSRADLNQLLIANKPNKHYESNLINSTTQNNNNSISILNNKQSSCIDKKQKMANVNNEGDSEKQQQQQQQQAALFKIRTANRRHLNFEREFDLNDLEAKNEITQWRKPFHFIQAADSQLGMINSYVFKRTDHDWSEEIKLCEELVCKCLKMEPKPKFMIICGDLADAWPSTEIRRQQVVDFKKIFAKLGEQIPLVCVCGNHDVGDEPTMSSVQEYRDNFGDDYFYFTLNDVLFIVINSQFYQHRENVKDYAEQQDEWLESMLKKCKLFKYSIVFEHIPWFLEHFDEEDDYFNIKKEVRLSWLRKFKQAGVTKIMCGHYHRNAGGWYENMELVVTSAIGAQCGSDQSGVRIVKVLDESIEHQYYAMQDIPQTIELP